MENGPREEGEAVLCYNNKVHFPIPMVMIFLVPMCYNSRDDFYGEEVDQDAGIIGATNGREPVTAR